MCSPAQAVATGMEAEHLQWPELTPLARRLLTQQDSWHLPAPGCFLLACPRGARGQSRPLSRGSLMKGQVTSLIWERTGAVGKRGPRAWPFPEHRPVTRDRRADPQKGRQGLELGVDPQGSQNKGFWRNAGPGRASAWAPGSGSFSHPSRAAAWRRTRTETIPFVGSEGLQALRLQSARPGNPAWPPIPVQINTGGKEVWDGSRHRQLSWVGTTGQGLSARGSVLSSGDKGGQGTRGQDGREGQRGSLGRKDSHAPPQHHFSTRDWGLLSPHEPQGAGGLGGGEEGVRGSCRSS